MNMSCASCGKRKSEDHPLFNCTACSLVKYCGIECQKKHWKQHKKECKKRAAELRDEILFKQPKSTHLGDCPICCLPMPLDPKEYMILFCCSKWICNGCAYALEGDARNRITCPFCREALTVGGADKQMLKRVEANDPVALELEGTKQCKKGNYTEALGHFEEAAKGDGFGAAAGHYGLAHMYRNGLGVEKDEKLNIHHLEEAAIGGHPDARYNLGIREGKNGNKERAIKHWIIAATQGHDDSLTALKQLYPKFLEKDVLAAALRAHKAAVDETKSPDRKAVGEFVRGKMAIKRGQ